MTQPTPTQPSAAREDGASVNRITSTVADQPRTEPSVGSPAPTVAGYDILGELGRGGMGVVYKARQVSLNRTVALKMILAGSHAGSDQRLRFRAEAEAAARLQHPNIVQIHDIGEAEGQLYCSLEIVGGGNLAERLGGTPQPPEQAAALIEVLARTIHVAHRAGVVHRDLKPANILLTEDGAPKIADFGLAKQLGNQLGLTASGAIIGTPSYMAPEQASGRGEGVGPACDVWALGAILYECLTGRPPFKAASQLDTLLQVQTQEPVPPSRLAPTCPRDLETICLKCLEKEPHKRFAGAEALADDLRRFLNHEPIQARPVGTAERLVRWARRRPAVAASLAVSGLALIALVAAVVLWSRAELRAADERARVEGERAEEAVRNEKTQTELRTAAEKEGARARAEAERGRRATYAAQLLAASALAGWDPDRGLESLLDANRCAPDLRDFTWDHLIRLCKRDRLTLMTDSRHFHALAFSPNGQTLAAVGMDERGLCEVRLWDPAAGRPRATLRGHRGVVRALAFFPDGKRIVSAGLDGVVKVWDAATGKEEQTLRAPRPAGVTGVAVSPDGKLLVWSQLNNLLVFWDIDGAKVRRTVSTRPPGRVAFENARKRPSNLALSPDGTLVAAGFNESGGVGADFYEVVVWDVASGARRATYLGHQEGILALAFAPDSKTLASGSKDGTVRLWDLASGKARAVLRGRTRAVAALAYSPDGQTLACGCGDASVRLCRASTGEEYAALKGHLYPYSVGALAYSPDGQTLASAAGDAVVKLWEVNLPRDRSTIAAHNLDIGRFRAYAYDAGLKTVARENADGTVSLWDAATETERCRLQGQKSILAVITFSPDGRTLATAEQPRAPATPPAVKLWDARTGSELVRLPARHL